MAKIYTKNGDGGFTSLIGGKKERKDAEIFDVIGTLDELNAFISFVDEKNIQRQLFELGALIANPKTTGNEYRKVKNWSFSIEKRIDAVDSKLPKLRNFIIPGGSEKAKYYQLCRAVCRRFERKLVRYFMANEQINSGIIEISLVYINRLSDLFFVLARYANFTEGIADEEWVLKKKRK